MSDSATLKNDAFRPRQPAGMAKGLMFALVAHALLIAGLTYGLRWKASDPAGIEAELWAAVPQAAAPRAVTPEPVAPPPRPVEAPPPEPTPPKPPEPPARVEPTPQQLQDAQIAIEKAKQEQERLDKERALRAAEEAERKKKEQLALEEAERLKKEKLAKEEQERRKKEQLAKDEAERQKKQQLAKEEQERKKKEQLAKDEAARKKKDEALAKVLDAARAENLARIQGQAGAAGATAVPGVAGATGAPTDRGTAARAAGPSSGYAGRIRARIQPNIVFADSVSGNPTATVEVRLASDGSIVSRRLTKSSGVPAWDDAVLRAIDKTEVLPRDTDGRVPSVMEIAFRPHD